MHQIKEGGISPSPSLFYRVILSYLVMNKPLVLHQETIRKIRYIFPLFSSIIRREGHLEFVCSNSTEEEFFPVTATFNSKSTYSTLEVCFDRSLLLLAVSRLRTSTFLIVMLLYPSSRVYPSLSTLILLSKHLVYNRVSCSSSLLLSDCFAFSCFFPFS